MIYIVNEHHTFEGETLADAARQARAHSGYAVPEAISVYSGKAAITEYDGDKFWLTLMTQTYPNGEWGYGETEQEALDHMAENA